MKVTFALAFAALAVAVLAQDADPESPVKCIPRPTDTGVSSAPDATDSLPEESAASSPDSGDESLPGDGGDASSTDDGDAGSDGGDAGSDGGDAGSDAAGSDAAGSDDAGSDGGDDFSLPTIVAPSIGV
ncbi:hypothetical protein LPJ59_002650 [Coemansia sp. RSA 2399]|nr:hypothetical protein LPJ59_002650 [Coemansia sp. RSA 2399]KAJ1904755.1 hypothetical protein LPJ81_002311 [Coemansia sp. IMI 209127]